LENIFDEYQQLSSRIKNSTGLGLSFCKMAVKAHGGEIGIKSEEEIGTTVWFTLPLAKNVSETKVEEKEIQNIKLKPEDKEILSNYISIFEQIDISQISAFRQLFKEIEDKYKIDKSWMNAFKNSIYNLNREEYNKFIEQLRN